MYNLIDSTTIFTYDLKDITVKCLVSADILEKLPCPEFIRYENASIRLSSWHNQFLRILC